jgi:hypothetical protein
MGSTLPEERRWPLLARLPTDPAAREAVLTAHHRAMAEGRPAYLDPGTGLIVLTAGSLWLTGSCCGSGCRHCPFAAGVRSTHSPGS